MIAVDSSALLAIVFNELQADAVEKSLLDAGHLAISAVTLAETSIVARRRSGRQSLEILLAPLPLEIVPANEAFAMKVADAYDLWGKGVHPAALNFVDCFAYVLAKDRSCPLLYVGDDFAQTDVASALAP